MINGPLKWSPDRVTQLAAALGRSRTLDDGLAEASRSLGFRVSRHSADDALRRSGYGTAASLLDGSDRLPMATVPVPPVQRRDTARMPIASAVELPDDSGTTSPAPPPPTSVNDLAEHRYRGRISALEARTKRLLDELAVKDEELASFKAIAREPRPITATTRPGDKQRKAVPVMLCSDWHVGETVDPATALARLGEFQVLTALREGAFGVSGVNAVIERALQRRGLIRAQAAHYPGRPLLIGSNDYALGLFNGDLGLLLPDPAGALRAWFTGPEGTPRALAPSRLPAHESAYALTVHKSQGSEFTRVLLILPPQPSPLLTRELIYTALTRAREGVTVWGSEATLAAAIGRRLERDSGLGDALRMG